MTSTKVRAVPVTGKGRETCRLPPFDIHPVFSTFVVSGPAPQPMSKETPWASGRAVE